MIHIHIFRSYTIYDNIHVLSFWKMGTCHRYSIQQLPVELTLLQYHYVSFMILFRTCHSHVFPFSSSSCIHQICIDESIHHEHQSTCYDCMSVSECQHIHAHQHKLTQTWSLFLSVVGIDFIK